MHEAVNQPLTLLTAATSWHADPLALVLFVAAGGGYLWARRRVAGWSRARTVAFCVMGLGGLLLVSVTFVGVYANTLFWVRALQVIVLLMVVPLGLAMGGPVTLFRQALGPTGRDRIDRVVAGRAVRLATHPATGSVLMLATPWLLYFTGWYPTMLRHGLADAGTRLALLTVGFVYFYGRLQLDPSPRRYPHLIALVISFAEELIDATLGLVLWLGPTLVAGAYYAGLHRGWGPSLRMDQIVGAGILWIGGDLAGLPFLGALLRRMSARDTEEAAEADRRLAEAEAALAIPPNEHPSATGIDAAPAQPRMMRPWWEDDPQLTERFHRPH